MGQKTVDGEKRREWERTIREAARSGISVSQFCRQRNLKENQFYWWRRRLGEGPMSKAKHERSQPSFALVTDQPGALDAGIELVLGDGRRLRVARGADEETLRAVLSALGS
jgi:transposase-like protein